MHKAQRILLVGGGSGGHIVPNLAIATAVKAKNPNAKLLYVGSRYPLDAELVRQADIPFKAVLTGKFRRYFSLRNFVDPFLVIAGFLQSLFIVLRFNPNVVMVKGGFVSFPVTLAAYVLRKPIVVHESDRSMGLANRIAARMADVVCTSFDDVVPRPKNMVVTGNPLRSGILDGSAEAGYKLTGFRAEKPVLLVWGGSLGAKQINDLIEQNFDRLKDTFQIIHITGKGKTTNINDPAYKSFEYLNDELKDIYAITDLVVGRAGANSLFELALLKKPNVLIPLQQNNDQKLNAEYFENKNASVIWRSGDDLVEILEAIWHNSAKLEAMKSALASIAKPDAAQQIAEIILQYENRH